MNLTELYHNLSIISFVLTVIFLLISAFLFHKWKIPKIFDDLTGRSEKRRIAEIKERGIESVVSDNYRAGVKRIYQTKGKTSSQELKSSGKLFSGKILSGKGNTGKTNSGRISTGKTDTGKNTTGRILFGRALTGKTSKSRELREMTSEMSTKKSVANPGNVTIPLEQYGADQKEKIYEATVPLDRYMEENQNALENNMMVSGQSMVLDERENFTSLLVREEDKGNEFPETGLLGLDQNQSSNILEPVQAPKEMKLVFSFESTGSDKIIQGN